MEISEELLIELCRLSKNNPRLRQSYDLRNSVEENSQRMLNALQPGTEIPIHRHTKSSEIVIIIQGSIRENFYNDNGQLTESQILSQGCSIPILVVPKGTWHNVECVETDTIIFECKDGAYEPIQDEDIKNI